MQVLFKIVKSNRQHIARNKKANNLQLIDFQSFSNQHLKLDRFTVLFVDVSIEKTQLGYIKIASFAIGL